MGRSTRLAGCKVHPPINFTPKITEQEAAEQFQSAVLDFSAGQLARASGRSKDTAKCWKAARTFPNGASLINMARAIPAVREWLAEQMDAGNRTSEADIGRIVRQEIERMQRGG